MKARRQKLRRNEGSIVLVPESLDDLWHLKHLVSPGARATAWTKRKVEVATDKARPDEAPREAMRLTVRADEVEFHRTTHRLRIRGPIQEGTDIGKSHALTVEPFTEVTIEQTWRADQLERIREAARESRTPKIFLLTIEEGEAAGGDLRQWGVEEKFMMGGTSGKGAGQQDRRRQFHLEVAEALSRHEGADVIVVAGPGFAKEDFHKVLKDKHPALARKVVLETCGHTGPAGFQELLRRGVVAHIAQTARLAREAQLIEELMAQVAKGAKAAYGLPEVQRAAQSGAIETLLVADSLLGKFDEGLGVMVERARGRVVVFSTEAEPGKRLEALGGLAALLRFKI